jgi:hypothetical protein
MWSVDVRKRVETYLRTDRLLMFKPIIEIDCGLISGYTAKLAAFARKERLDIMSGTDGYCGRFLGETGNFNIGIHRLLGSGKLTVRLRRRKTITSI